MLNWYAETIEETAKRSAVDINTGLSERKAARRLERYGKNTTREIELKSFSQLFFSQLKDFTFILLLSAAAISVVIAVNRPNGNWLQPIIILLICIFHALIGAFRDKWTQEELMRLRDMTVTEMTVLRGGTRQQISTHELVPGDIFFFCEGDRIPADGRLIHSEGLICDEHSIGGADSTEKNASALLDVTTPLSERTNMVYFSATVLSGNGAAIATATGMNTVAGVNSGLLVSSSAERETPLQHSTNELQKPIGVATLIVCALIFFIGFSWRYSMQVDAIETLLTAFALSVSVIPEVLSSFSVLAKVAGAERLAKKHAVVRKIKVMENLSSVSVICADKTGVLTCGSMEPVKLWTAADGRMYADLGTALNTTGTKLLEYAALCSNDSDKKTELYGPEPTDIAVIPVLEKHQIKKTHLDLKYPRKQFIPFERSERMMMTVHSSAGGSLIIARGAPEAILKLCDTEDIDRLNAIVSQLGSEQLRVIAVAARELAAPPEDVTDDAMRSHLTLVGFIGMRDPLRERTQEAAAICQKAGIRVIMTTGDHPATAAAVATECGILRDGDEVLTGEQLDALSDAELNANIRKYSVYARIKPADKLRIVTAWQKYNEVVALTGVAVDDVAPLIAADVGFAPRSAAAAAQMASDAVMPEGSLTAVAASIREGRTVCTNIRSTAKYMLQCDIAAALMMMPGIIICGTFPLLSIHLLIVSLIITFICSAAVCTEPSYGESMLQPPYSRSADILNGSTLISALISGFISSALSVAAFFIGSRTGVAAGRAMAFGTLIITEIVGALICRMPANGYRPGVRHNRVMMYAGGICSAVVILCLLLMPGALMLTGLTVLQWVLVVALGAAPMLFTEIFRLLRDMTRGSVGISSDNRSTL